MFESPAFAQATNGPPPSGLNVFMNSGIPMMLLVVLIFYVLVFRPQQTRTRQHREMLGGVKPRDTAVTSGGLIGKVTKVDDNEVELEIAQGVRVRVVKTMLSDIRPHGAKAAND